MTQLVTVSANRTPALIVAAGDRAAYRFVEFFTAQTRNPNTRRAYMRAVGAFLTWLEAQTSRRSRRPRRCTSRPMSSS